MSVLESRTPWFNWWLSFAIHGAGIALLVMVLSFSPEPAGKDGGSKALVIEWGAGGIAKSSTNRIAKGESARLNRAPSLPQEEKATPEASSPLAAEALHELSTPLTPTLKNEPKNELQSDTTAKTPEETPEEAPLKAPRSDVSVTPATPSSFSLPANAQPPKTPRQTPPPTKKTSLTAPKTRDQTPEKTSKPEHVKPRSPLTRAPQASPAPSPKSNDTLHASAHRAHQTLTQAQDNTTSTQKTGTSTGHDNVLQNQLVGSGEGLKKRSEGEREAGLINNGDGTYSLNGKGTLQFHILRDANPQYPRLARAMGYQKVIRIKVKFLVGLDGKVERADVLTKNVPELGFKDEALTAIEKMVFEPITFHGLPLKVYFKKTIIFQP